MPLAEIHAVVSIALTIAGFYCYHYIHESGIPSRMVRQLMHAEPEQTMTAFVGAKLSGFLFLGVLPYLILRLFFELSPQDLGLRFGRTGEFWPLLVLLPLLFITLSFFTTKRSSLQAMYPQMRITNWFPGQLFLSLAGWSVYLFAYEFLFRGVLWFLCFQAFGFWPALAINLALYSALHMPKGLNETIGAIPLGALVCLLTWLTDSIIMAFLTHIAMAASTEFFAIRHNPDMHFRFFRQP